LEDSVISPKGRYEVTLTFEKISQAGWLMDSFMNTELRKLPETLNQVMRDPWNSLPILQEPEVRDAVALILQAKAEVEARRVLKAIGLTDQQSRLFLEINRTSTSLPNATISPTSLRAALTEQMGAASNVMGAGLAQGAAASFNGSTAAAGALLEQMGVSNGSLNLWEVGAGRVGSMGGLGGEGNVSNDFTKLAASLKAWESSVTSRYKDWDLDSDGTVSWIELWESLYGARAKGAMTQNMTRNSSLVSAMVPMVPTVPTVPSSSLLFLESVQSQVSISPVIFAMLRDAAALTLIKDRSLLMLVGFF
jgi:hypothetical protein